MRSASIRQERFSIVENRSFFCLDFLNSPLGSTLENWLTHYLILPYRFTAHHHALYWLSRPD